MAGAVRIPGIGRVAQWLRRVNNRFSPGGLILLYHRVTRLQCDPQWLAVSPEHFGQHLEVLRCGRGRLFPLRELAAAFCGDRVKPPHRALAVTFDDGYADNLTSAKPLLEKHDCPATVFVTSGFVDGPEEFYWDELGRLLLEGDGSVPRAWNVLCERAPTPRQREYREACARLTPMSEGQRRGLMAAIRARVGGDGRARASHRGLTEAEVRALAEGGLVEVGAHTVSHPRLASLDVEEQRREIDRGKRALEAITGGSVTSFSYPYGNHGDFTDQTVAAVKAAGFERACVNHGGSVRAGADPFRLNRVIVRDWDGDEFERRLRGWFDE